jgi:hypothetical protein
MTLNDCRRISNLSSLENGHNSISAHRHRGGLTTGQWNRLVTVLFHLESKKSAPHYTVSDSGLRQMHVGRVLGPCAKIESFVSGEVGGHVGDIQVRIPRSEIQYARGGPAILAYCSLIL